MTEHRLTEGEWGNFVEEEVLPLCILGEAARVLALVGDLGAGKTTFSKTLLKQIGVEQHVQSPTFSIINSYDISFNGFKKVFHIDAYRIEDCKELEVLHFDEIVRNPESLVLVEWADIVKALIPQHATWITFRHDTMETRIVTIEHGKN